MRWLSHKVTKPVLGVLIGLFGLLETFWPGLAAAVDCRAAQLILGGLFGTDVLARFNTFARWTQAAPG